MPVSKAGAAKRAFVKLLLTLATFYGLALTVTREAPDAEFRKAYKRVSLKAHPDKGGTLEHSQSLNAAKEAWEQAKEQSHTGRPKRQDAKAEKGHKHPQPTRAELPGDGGAQRPDFRVRSVGVLLTHQGVQDLAQWRRFLCYVRLHQAPWKVKYWRATLEACKGGALHIHMFIQFSAAVDRDRRSFSFENLVPNASPNDLLDEKPARKKIQESLNRGFFYTWANKLGTQRDEEGRECVDGNYFPAWTGEKCTYPVRGQWPKSLWQAYKLSPGKYEEYLYACRDGVPTFKRLCEVCKDKEDEGAQAVEIQARIKRIRNNSSLYKTFPQVPEADAWLQVFKEDRLRYPILILLGPSGTGKTEYAKSLFQAPLELKLGPLEHFPEGMRMFNRQRHDGIVLDDCRDLRFLVNNQEKLQGKYDSLVEFATTPGGQCAYTKDLYGVPIVVTANLDTAHRDLLTSSDWLSQAANRVLVLYPPPGFDQGLP